MGYKSLNRYNIENRKQIYFVCKTISDIFDAYKDNNIDNTYKEAKKK